MSRSDKPLSRVEASQRVSFPFPASAQEIYFLVHSGGLQEFQLFVRFHVDPAEMESTVEGLLAGHSPTTLLYDPAGIEQKEFLPMPWWSPNAITRGERHSADHPPIYVWTDTDRSVIFVCTTD